MVDQLSPGDRVSLLRFELYYRAALIIQRSWRTFQRLAWKHMRCKRRRNCMTSRMAVSNLNTVIEKVMTDTATSEEKNELWRSVIELRRTRHHYTTDACIRSLIECKGDLTRTLLISGNTTFGWR
jgi:hypothetical protein